MKQSVTQWFLGLAFVAFPVGCLVLAFYLIAHLPEPMEMAEEEDPAIPKPETVSQLPDFRSISDIPARKRAFFEMLLPMVEWRNSQLKQLRAEIEALRDARKNTGKLTSEQRARLEKLRIHFRVSEDNYPDTGQALEALRRRADIIPSDMVLAQAAAESGWGTSRFAVEANNLFGQWCYRKGCGLVPNARAEDMSHEVQKFASVNEALATYFRNINTNRAYREVRQIRAKLRANDQPLKGLQMVEGLHRYSSRGQAYIEELKELIRYNDLENIQARLAEVEAQEEAEAEAEAQEASQSESQ
ncbi:glucosaminidase domain-containing protein [Marinimicrobium sp. C2-29]|uniref:glucosaminidase domain-containing protein n=1 Tax=Marinimicrobium sp. C2-29 TaxID=3139825 RepID=UPI0031397836